MAPTSWPCIICLPSPPQVFRASLLVVPDLRVATDPPPTLYTPSSQVFRASLLVVPDLRVASDPAFSAISVTAEQWVPMAEVTEGALLPWLERKQAQG